MAQQTEQKLTIADRRRILELLESGISPKAGGYRRTIRTVEDEELEAKISYERSILRWAEKKGMPWQTQRMIRDSIRQKIGQIGSGPMEKATDGKRFGGKK